MSPRLLASALAAPTAALALALLAAATAAPSLGAQEVQRPRATVATRPPAPANVRAARTGDRQVTITWDAVEGATAYDVGRLVRNSGWQRVTRVPASAGARWVDANRDLSLAHTYRVVTIAGDMASLPAMSNELAPNSPVGGLRNADPTPNPQEGGSGAATVPSGAGCTPAGGNQYCTSNVMVFGFGSRRLVGVAYCPEGTMAVGGGWDGVLMHQTIVEHSRPVYDDAKGRPGWSVQVVKVLENPIEILTDAARTLSGRMEVSFQAYAVCAPAR